MILCISVTHPPSQQIPSPLHAQSLGDMKSNKMGPEPPPPTPLIFFFLTLLGLSNCEISYYQPLVYKLCGKSSRKCHPRGKLWVGEICSAGCPPPHQSTVHWKGEKEGKHSDKWVKHLSNELCGGGPPSRSALASQFCYMLQVCLLLRYACTHGSSNEVPGKF